MYKSKTAIYQYKCRMCGRTFDSSTESSGDTDIVDRVLVNSICRTANISDRVPMQVVHWCKDGNFGIADLAGARIVKEQ
jgi:transposase-like protein